MPFTTGILVGIGETLAERLDALLAIATPTRHGHVQEVIVQNFLPKPGTKMHKHEPPDPRSSPGRSLWPVSCSGPAMHLQAPPNLSDDLGAVARRRASTTGVASRRSRPTT